MQFVIDAWLERKDPLIRLLNAETGREIFRCSSERLQPLLESGQLSIEDIEDEELDAYDRLGLGLIDDRTGKRHA